MYIIKRLQELGHNIDIHDPHARPEDVEHEYGMKLVGDLPAKGDYDGIALAVAHNEYKSLKPGALEALLKQDGFIYDLKGAWRDHKFSAGTDYQTL